MSEKDQRRRVVKALRELHAIAVENPARVGTPDVNYAGGWIELKWLRQWPVKPETPVRFPHFTLTQKAWITQRAKVGGNIWVLIQCKKDWLIFDGPTAVTKSWPSTRLHMAIVLFKVAHRLAGITGGGKTKSKQARPAVQKIRTKKGCKPYGTIINSPKA